MTDPRTRVRRWRAALWDTTARGLDRVSDLVGDARRTSAFLAGRLRFEERDDDIFVATYPRSGTTWMQFMLYLLTTDGAMNFRHIGEVTPWWERSLALGTQTPADYDRLPSPRVFKTHLVPRWLPRRGRFIHVVRDVADVAVSYFQFYRTYLRFTGDFEAFLEAFTAGRLQYGSWHDHHAHWDADRHRRVLPVRYRDLVDDGAGTLGRICAFLSLPADPDRIRSVLARASFERMKRDEAKFDHATSVLLDRGIQAGHFIRSGPRPDPGEAREWAEALRQDTGRPPGRINLASFLQ